MKKMLTYSVCSVNHSKWSRTTSSTGLRQCRTFWLPSLRKYWKTKQLSTKKGLKRMGSKGLLAVAYTNRSFWKTKSSSRMINAKLTRSKQDRKPRMMTKKAVTKPKGQREKEAKTKKSYWKLLKNWKTSWGREIKSLSRYETEMRSWKRPIHLWLKVYLIWKKTKLL